MIICKHVGFVQIPKNGGESIRMSLLGSGNECYYITPVIESGSDIKSLPNRYRPHLTPDRYAPFISSQVKLMTSVRNPWDRYVSWFHWHNDNHETEISWEKFLAHVLNDRSGVVTSQDIYFKGVNYRWIIRFENLAEEWVQFCEESGIHSPLPHYNKSTNRKEYREYYSNKQRGLVLKKEGWLIDRFGYTF